MVFKLIRILTLWTAVFFTDKIFQDKFINQVYYDIQNENSDRRYPNLHHFIWVVILIDMVLFGLILLASFSAAMFVEKTSMNSMFVIDTQLLRLIFIDFLMSIIVIFVLGYILADTIQKMHQLRFKDVGIRGIRAYSTLIIFVNIVVMLIPYYKIANS